MTTLAILLFPGAEELDFVGPFEAFAMSSTVGRAGRADWPGFDICFVAETAEPVAGAKGMRVVPDATLDEIARPDMLLVPGGNGTRAACGNARLCGWIKDAAAQADWTLSVCTGARLLLAAGPARGKTITTHFSAIEELRAGGLAKAVLSETRYVRDGSLVTAAGVSAGIDMALWVIERIHGPAHARAVQKQMEYMPAPPQGAAV